MRSFHWSAQRGAAMIEAALSLALVLTFVTISFSYAHLIVLRAQWHDLLNGRFNKASLQYTAASPIEDTVLGDDSFICTEDSTVPRCATRDFPCPEGFPSGCISTLRVSQSETSNAFVLDASLRVPCAMCSLFNGKSYLDFRVSSVKAGVE